MRTTWKSLPNVYRDPNRDWIDGIWEKIHEEQHDALTGITQDSNPETIDQRLAEEMNSLSLDERNRGLEALHGVANELEETPELLQQSIQATKSALQDDSLLPPSRKQAYLLALEADPSFVNDPNFIIAFLRSENFDAKRSAARMVLYLEKKKRHFGAEALTRSLHLGDLTRSERETLEAGAWQLLPDRDRSGRLVIFDHVLCGPQLYSSLEDQLRCILYCWFTLLEDEDTQKCGVVYITWYVGVFRESDREPRSPTVFNELFFLSRWLPARFRGAHVCSDGGNFKEVLVELQKVTTDSLVRPYFRVHDGAMAEIKKRLLSFGIPVDRFPLTTDGSIRQKNQTKWIAKRRYKERTVDGNVGWRDSRIDIPLPKDVLLGKGKPIQKHFGNNLLGFMVEKELTEHMKSTPSQKAHISWKIVNEVKASSGRFLSKDEYGWWIEVDDSEAREKVANTFSNTQAKVKRSTQAEASEGGGRTSKKKRRTKGDDI